MNRFLDFLALSFVVLLTLAFVYLVFVLLPVSALAERNCLRAGYPTAHTTFNLETYCSNLDGSVTVKVIPQ